MWMNLIGNARCSLAEASGKSCRPRRCIRRAPAWHNVRFVLAFDRPSSWTARYLRGCVRCPAGSLIRSLTPCICSWSITRCGIHAISGRRVTRWRPPLVGASTMIGRSSRIGLHSEKPRQDWRHRKRRSKNASLKRPVGPVAPDYGSR